MKDDPWDAAFDALHETNGACAGFGMLLSPWFNFPALYVYFVFWVVCIGVRMRLAYKRVARGVK